jgi:hypothetical protein
MTTFSIDAIVSVAVVIENIGGWFFSADLHDLDGDEIGECIQADFTPTITFTVEAKNEEEARETAEAELKRLGFEATPDITWYVEGYDINKVHESDEALA